MTFILKHAVCTILPVRRHRQWENVLHTIPISTGGDMLYNCGTSALVSLIPVGIERRYPLSQLGGAENEMVKRLNGSILVLLIL